MKSEVFRSLSKLSTKPHLNFNISYYYIYSSTFIPNKAQSASSGSANNTAHGISALLGTCCHNFRVNHKISRFEGDMRSYTDLEIMKLRLISSL